MERLIEIKNRLETIEKALGEQFPRFKADPELTEQITDLKDYVEAERKKIQKQKRLGELSELESSFIEPAINDVYLSSLDKIRRGSKPSNSVNEYICDTSSTLSYWLFQIRDYEGKEDQ
ncbi:hypothetical protein [Atlantibacter subterraneus]|uniref:hypothetical protein n=1 Tax=Atlantibacter subterraneus TaxID=255519 RepID=UPI0029650A05|nr:hypothetical protein [Atlantibacter subterranea]MDW2744823.1 hypothetical protein [Atlantibacter subterranea]